MATALSLKTLPDLPARVARPSYARDDLSPGIVHFGVGNFHRAHLQVYLDRLMNAGRDLDWAIVGAGVTPYDARMRDALAGQDWLSTVVEQSAAKSEARVTGVMTDFLPPMDGRAIIAGLADPATRIASLTVTEGGYFVNPALGKFDPEHPAIVADARNPDDPKTVFGLILAGLKARRAAGRAPFTVMSCD
ncbi:MAG: mannitol dehydrogenase family protein, partial [Rhodobacteraceae bacterium]|nr:mannitol dehydrogenase family protein [Paracoccaceae bacterium]